MTDSNTQASEFATLLAVEAVEVPTEVSEAPVAPKPMGKKAAKRAAAKAAAAAQPTKQVQGNKPQVKAVDPRLEAYQVAFFAKLFDTAPEKPLNYAEAACALRVILLDPEHRKVLDTGFKVEAARRRLMRGCSINLTDAEEAEAMEARVIAQRAMKAREEAKILEAVKAEEARQIARAAKAAYEAKLEAKEKLAALKAAENARIGEKHRAQFSAAGNPEGFHKSCPCDHCAPLEAAAKAAAKAA
jgi:hypothetical protein